METDNQYQDPKRALFKALAKAQSEIKPPPKNATANYPTKSGATIKFKYADLAGVIEAIKTPFANNGLSHCHVMEYRDSQFGLVTALNHELGASIETWHPLPDPSKMPPQQFAANLTYARRYSLSSLAGVAADEDTDGAGAEPPESPKPKSKPKAQSPQTYPQYEESPPMPDHEGPQPSFDDLNSFEGYVASETMSEEEAARKRAIKSMPHGSFKITFGKKYNGKMLSEIPPKQLREYLDWLVDTYEVKNMPLTQDVNEALIVAGKYFNALQS